MDESSVASRKPKREIGIPYWVLMGGACAVLIVVFAVSIRSTVQQSTAPQRVQALLEEQETAWNKGDLDGFMQGYWNDPELTFYSDNVVEKGYDQLKQRYQRKYKDDGKEMGKLSFSDVEFRAESPKFTVVRGRWKVVKSTETRDGLFTLWIEKKPEGWRIIHDHTSVNELPKK
jgi:beta-aspartyl-peptidase (threonine type)